MSIIDRIQDTYNALDATTLESGLLGELYDRDIVFVDPLHRIEGLPALQQYFQGLYRNVIDISFRYLTHWEDGDEAMLRWEMTFRHPKLHKGHPIVVPGVTYVRFDRRITWHQDYFDSNQLIFDHLPLLGPALGWLKGRLN